MVRSGPVLYTVRGVSGVSIGAGSSLGPIAFRFPEPRFVTGLLLVPQSGAAADLASLSLSVTDEESDALFVFRGLEGGAASALSLFGGLSLPFVAFPFVQPFGLQRPVVAGDVWRFTIANVGGGAIVPNLLIFSDEASER